MIEGKVLLTGGGGTLGLAIIRRSVEEKWDCEFTIFSNDPVKHFKVKQKFPKVQSVIGDVRDFNSLYNSMTGKDYCLHLAATKHIPVSEYNPCATIEINVTGTLNVAQAAFQLGTPHVLAISTDKAAHPVNAYGATKMLNEKIFQEYARLGVKTQYHLLRYGNVIESTGSVIEAWHRAVGEGKPIKITDPEMSRFWLSPSQAVQLVVYALQIESGVILIPKLPALSIGKLAEYTVGKHECEIIPTRPGEKKNEDLLTIEETEYATESQDFFFLRPTTSEKVKNPCRRYSSDMARELTQKELQELLND